MNKSYDIEKDILEKKIVSTLDFIRNFQQNVKIIDLSKSQIYGKLSIENQHIRIDLQNYLYKQPQKIFNGIKHPLSVEINVDDNNKRIYTSNTIYVIENNSIRLSNLMDKRWAIKGLYYYRMVLPIERYFWLQEIETEGYKTTYRLSEKEIRTRFTKGLISINLLGYPIHIYPAEDSISKEKFIFVESQTECTYEIVCKYLQSISLSLGLITSIAPFDYSYVVASKSTDFEKETIYGFSRLRKSIKADYRFFTTDLSYIEHNLKFNLGSDTYALKQIQDKKGQLKKDFQVKMLMSEFKNLVETLCNEDLFRAAQILMDSLQMPLYLQGPLYSVVLETIATVSCDGNDTYIEDEKWRNCILPKFENLIMQLIGHDIDKEQAEKMRNKLVHLNNESNRYKLSLPFRQIGIKLPKKESEILNLRNMFSHGKIKGKNEKNDEIENEIYFQDELLLYRCLKLQQLCVLWLFRKAGFKGRILNNAVLLGLEKAINEEESILIE